MTKRSTLNNTVAGFSLSNYIRAAEEKKEDGGECKPA
ncbi:hypothetical protein T4C_11950 [Trichinella pseudospiralis]|uniref:Uncharacterized protein n=1 Tax=Trichinella pseudospiralis TaxID=6337 RepID=A0A0V1GGF3_TRIPS|nr:hypothetical protein T4C_11950 [Trichinella pseudospiralis]